MRNMDRNEEEKQQVLCLFNIYHRFMQKKTEISESMRIFYQLECNVNNQSR